MSFIYYKRRNGYSALNLNQIKELYVIEVSSDTLELWADNVKVHTLNKETLKEYMSCDDNMESFYYNCNSFKNALPSSNRRLLNDLTSEEFSYYLKKISVDFLYALIARHYVISCIKMSQVKNATIMFEDNKIDRPTLYFNLISAMGVFIKRDKDKIYKEVKDNEI